MVGLHRLEKLLILTLTSSLYVKLSQVRRSIDDKRTHANLECFKILKVAYG